MKDKYPKEAAVYRKSTGDKACKDCAYFNSEERSCEMVEGTIRPNDVCAIWREIPRLKKPGE